MRQPDTAEFGRRRARSTGDRRAPFHPPHTVCADHQRCDVCSGRRALPLFGPDFSSDGGSDPAGQLRLPATL